MCFLKRLLIAGLVLFAFVVNVSSRPNVVFIIADDLGWHDVSFHGSDQIPTPNIDLLAYTGVSLHRYYSHSLCTPSRSAILTGKFAHKLGMQGYPLLNAEDRGVPLTEKLLPQYFKELGYSTHLVGKWHAGHSRYAYLPTFRGYDSHYGHRGGYLDYYEYTSEEMWSTGKVSGLDLFRNVTADWTAEGYVTDLYTKEAKNIIESHDVSKPLLLTVAHNAPHSGNDGALLQAPPQDVRAMRHVESPQRRIFAAMVKKLDDSVGDIVDALSEKGILNNTMIIFVADNGAPTQGLSINYGSNWPLRGEKNTPWEGGIRVVGLIWSQNLKKSNYLWNGYMHAVDLLPTIIGAVDGPPIENIDGLNLWNNIIEDGNSERDEFFEIYETTGFSSIVRGNYKLVTGDVDKLSSEHLAGDLRGIIGKTPSYNDTIKKSKVYEIFEKSGMLFNMDALNIRNQAKLYCRGAKTKECHPDKDSWCLYNIIEDPCEEINLSDALPELGESLLSRLIKELENVVSRKYPIDRDPRGMPSLFNYTWNSFLEKS